MKNVVPIQYLRGVNSPRRLYFKYFQDFSVCIHMEKTRDKIPCLVLLKKTIHSPMPLLTQ